jgi:DNA invertase Pin-like site-specific DNA recombinase
MGAAALSERREATPSTSAGGKNHLEESNPYEQVSRKVVNTPSLRRIQKDLRILTGEDEEDQTSRCSPLARDQALAGHIETVIRRAGAELISIDEAGLNPITKAVLTMVAEVERLLAAQRTRFAMRALKLKGKTFGTVPFGYRRKRRWRPRSTARRNRDRLRDGSHASKGCEARRHCCAPHRLGRTDAARREVVC